MKFMDSAEETELIRLVQSIVKAYGVSKMADRLGIAYSTLANKINPDAGEDSRHHLSLREFRLIMDITRDYRPLHLICMDTGHIAVETHHHKSDRSNWLDLQAKSAYSHGKKADTLLRSIACGKLGTGTGCINAVRSCREHTYDAATADLEIYTNLSDLERELKARHH